MTESFGAAEGEINCTVNARTFCFICNLDGHRGTSVKRSMFSILSPVLPFRTLSP